MWWVLLVRACARALFIIDPKGVLRSVVINDDTVGRSVAEVHRLLTAFQFTAANDGMACPVNWAPGAWHTQPCSHRLRQ